uniref:ubiquitin carboxyl-terminal hydrolase 17-like n=1 Tax=Erigeron canadensis TaxID=72917 RepID=UPI001CB8AE72|nr:ubiquitin carboxyl-terminal hydrolase 17-like [Erigeron canadensis]
MLFVQRVLGFPFIVVVVVGVFVLIIWRRWRQAVVRSEEVRRLLVNASEEAFRVELFKARESGFSFGEETRAEEPVQVRTAAPAPSVYGLGFGATEPAPVYEPVYGSGQFGPGPGYGSGVKLAYKCVVCLSSTTTRCSKCKAVRYCSGKCQIIHWRQGHKDECRPYVAANSVNNVEAGFYRHSDGFDTEVKQNASLAGTVPENGYLKDDVGAEYVVHQQGAAFENFETVKSADEPLTNASGFSYGSIRNRKSSVSEHVGCPPGSFGKIPNGYMANHGTKGVNNSCVIEGLSAANVVDGSGLTGVACKTSVDIADSSNNLVNNVPMSRGPSTSTFETLNHSDRAAVADLPTIKVAESKTSLSSATAHHDSTAAEGNKSMTPLMTSVISKKTSHGTKSVKVVDNHQMLATSSQLSDNSRSESKSSKSKVVDSKLSREGSIEGGSEAAQRYSFKGLFPYEMFVKLYNSKQVELQPCGLNNCGNSCYANAVLQCLIYTPPLTAYLFEGLHSKTCDKKGWCFTCELEGLVMKAKNGYSPSSPVRIINHIENTGSNIGRGKEEDAHEFLRYVIDALQAVCIWESGLDALNSLQEETTLIGLTFGGYLRSKIICIKCGLKSEQHERMMDLAVEIQGDIGTLEEALDKFTSTELLDGENKYKCSRCKSYEKAKKKLTLLEAPNVLTIALKRFQSGNFGKLNKSIHFPEILDMAPYVSGTSDKSPIYRLYGVVVHVDTMNDTYSGHYVCYVKNLQNRWFKFDDSMVEEVELQHVLTKGAYMLLYARCSPRAPRSIRSSLTHHNDPRKHKTPPSFVPKSHSTESWDACIYHSQVINRYLEEEYSSSDNSGFFSESCSCSTDATRRNSATIEDHDYWKNTNMNSSDSDSSSSSSFPSPSRLSQLYTLRTLGKNDCKKNKACRNLDRSCNCCRVTNLSSLGGPDINQIVKPDVTFRKSTIRGKSD